MSKPSQPSLETELPKLDRREQVALTRQLKDPDTSPERVAAAIAFNLAGTHKLYGRECMLLEDVAATLAGQSGLDRAEAFAKNVAEHKQRERSNPISDERIVALQKMFDSIMNLAHQIVTNERAAMGVTASD